MYKLILPLLICLLALISCSEFHRGTMDTTGIDEVADTVPNHPDGATTTNEGMDLGGGENAERKREKKDEDAASSSKLDGELVSILNAIYENTKVDEKWPTLVDTRITNDNIEFYLGTTEIDFDRGVVREPLVSGVPHSVCVIRVNEGDDVEEVKSKVMESANPEKWLFAKVDRDKVIVDSKSDIVILIMTNANGEKLRDSFLNLDI